MSIVNSLFGNSTPCEKMRELARQHQQEAQELLRRADEMDNKTNIDDSNQELKLANDKLNDILLSNNETIEELKKLKEENAIIKTQIQMQNSPEGTVIVLASRTTEDIDLNAANLDEVSKIESNDIIESLAQLIEEVRLTQEAVKESLRKDIIIKDMHDELQKYKSGLKKDIISPMIKSMIQWYDRLTDLNAFYEEEHNITDLPDEKSPSKALKEYANLPCYILDMIYDYDIEPISVKVGDIYSPKKHRALTVIETIDETQDNTIAEIKRTGFEDVVLDRVLRHCNVIVYKYKIIK